MFLREILVSHIFLDDYPTVWMCFKWPSHSKSKFEKAIFRSLICDSFMNVMCLLMYMMLHSMCQLPYFLVPLGSWIPLPSWTIVSSRILLMSCATTHWSAPAAKAPHRENAMKRNRGYKPTILGKSWWYFLDNVYYYSYIMLYNYNYIPWNTQFNWYFLHTIVIYSTWSLCLKIGSSLSKGDVSGETDDKTIQFGGTHTFGETHK